jgi:hypothetical protein
LRANLNTLRSVANRSARSAVAASQVSRTATQLRWYLIGSGLGWAATTASWYVEGWLGMSQHTPSWLLMMFSEILTAMAILRYLDLPKGQRSLLRRTPPNLLHAAQSEKTED